MKNKTLKDYQEKIEPLWQDRKHIAGFPFTFTKYSMSEDRLFVKKGLLFESEHEVLLYRVKDITVKRNLWQKICGVGSLIVESTDSSTPIMVIKNIPKPFLFKEMLHDYVERNKKTIGVTLGEILR